MAHTERVFCPRVLRGFGLLQGPEKDFLLRSDIRDADNRVYYTSIELRSPYARRLCAQYADVITERFEAQRVSTMRITVDDRADDPDEVVVRIDDHPRHVPERHHHPEGREPVRVRYAPEHVRYAEAADPEGAEIAALYIPAPLDYHRPDEVWANIRDRVEFDGVEVIGWLKHRPRGRMWPRPMVGWALADHTGTFGPMPLRTKREGVWALKSMVESYFRVRRG